MWTGWSSIRQLKTGFAGGAMKNTAALVWLEAPSPLSLLGHHHRYYNVLVKNAQLVSVGILFCIILTQGVQRLYSKDVHRDLDITSWFPNLSVFSCYHCGLFTQKLMLVS